MSEFSKHQPQDALTRCRHGVWIADHCFSCEEMEQRAGVTTPDTPQPSPTEEVRLPELEVAEEDRKRAYAEYPARSGYNERRFCLNWVIRERQLKSALAEIERLKREMEWSISVDHPELTPEECRVIIQGRRKG